MTRAQQANVDASRGAIVPVRHSLIIKKKQ
jgi:hypothetical protein